MASELGWTSRAKDVLMKKASFSCHRHVIADQDSSHNVKSNEDHDQCNPGYT